MSYTIVWNMPGYLPEMDPYELEGTLADAIMIVREEVERFAEGELEVDTGREAEWEAVIAAIDADFLSATDLAAGGVDYDLPNGYVISATKTEEG